MKKYIPEQQPNQFHCYKQNMGFVSRLDQNVAKYWYPNEKMVVVPQYPGAWVLYRISKDKGDEPLPPLAFQRHGVIAIFLKYSKEGRLCSSHLGIRNIPSDVCYDDTKHDQVCFCVNSLQLKIVNWIRKKTPSWMFEGVLNTPLLKAGVRCTKRTLDVATWIVSLRDMRFEIFQPY